MKRAIIAVCLTVLCLGAAKNPVYDPHRDGAAAELDIHVVDELGCPVPSVDLRVSFAIGPAEGMDRSGQTDSEGGFHASCRTTGSIWILAQKDGYYQTRLHVDAQDVPYEEAVKTHRWSNGPVKTTVVLKTIRHPVQLTMNGCGFEEMPWPATNTVLGFDLELFDWCPPYGFGKHDDLQLKYDFWRSSTNWDQAYAHLTMTMTNCVDGLYLEPVEEFSQLKRCYHADPDAVYQQRMEFVHDRRSGDVDRRNPMPKDQYMVFRTRTKTNAIGEITSANYGMIFERGKFGLEWNIRAGFNPTPNDTNLECVE
ncbi:MAG: hypothetical protein IKQ55_07935 [Kiritimatiellae bacterium]|nr:hypothetical protein [Kiritimatiellia bacterium]